VKFSQKVETRVSHLLSLPAYKWLADVVSDGASIAKRCGEI